MANGPEQGIAMTSMWSRRDVLIGVGWGLVAGGLALSGKVLAAAVGRRPRASRRLLAGGPISALPTGGQRSVGEVIVVRDPAGVGAVSSRCTHLGCTVTANARGFECPCHGSTFARDGRALSGPATRDLPWYRVLLGEDGEIRIDLDAEVGPDERLDVDET